MAMNLSAASNNADQQMPPASADLAMAWAFLEEGLDHIMTRLQKGISYSKYMCLSIVAYNYCTSSRTHHTVGFPGKSCYLPLQDQ